MGIGDANGAVRIQVSYTCQDHWESRVWHEARGFSELSCPHRLTLLKLFLLVAFEFDSDVPRLSILAVLCSPFIPLRTTTCTFLVMILAEPRYGSSFLRRYPSLAFLPELQQFGYS